MDGGRSPRCSLGAHVVESRTGPLDLDTIPEADRPGSLGACVLVEPSSRAGNWVERCRRVSCWRYLTQRM
jgi:hypothetical protein